MKKGLQIFLWAVLLLFPIAWSWYMFNKYALNIPHWDDHALKAFVSKFQKSTDFSEQISLVFAQHNEHRIALTRLFSLLIFYIKGDLDFKWLMAIGNFSLVGVVAVFYAFLKKNKINAFLLIPFVWILFNASLYEIAFWGMTSVQNFGVIFLTILSFYLLFYSPNFTLALLISSLSIITSGNGILVAIIGALVLAFSNNKKQLIVWSLLHGVLLFAYFFFLEKRPDSQAVIWQNLNVIRLIKSIFVFLGASIDSFWLKPSLRLSIAIFSAITLLISICMILFRKYRNHDLKSIQFIVSIVLFISGTACLIAISRYSYNIEVMFTSKYKIYSSILLGFVMLLGAFTLSQNYLKVYIPISIFIGVIVWLNAYLIDYKNIIYTYQERRADLTNWNFEAIKANRTLNRELYAPSSKDIINIPTHSINDSTKIDLISSTDKEIQFSGINLNADENTYILLKSDSLNYLIPAYPQVNKSKKSVFFHYFASGFIASLSKINFPTNQYTLYIITENQLINCKKNTKIEGLVQPEAVKNW